MRTLLVLLAALLALTPTSLAATGPFVGTVAQGETDVHTYDNHPPRGGLCMQVMVSYTVTLTWAPGTDTLTLSAGGKTVTATGGLASVTFSANACTRFTVSVTGTNVLALAAYEATVTGGALGGVADLDRLA